MIYCYVDTSKANSRQLLEAFSDGLKSSGESVEIVTDLQPRDGPAVFYGVSPAMRALYEHYVKRCLDYYMIDNGYINSKWHGGTYYRVVKNGRFHSGAGNSDGKRFEALGIKIKPWRQGRQLLIALQSDWWYQLNGTSKLGWITKTRNALTEYGWMGEIVFRDKPKTKSVPKICWPCTYAVVTHSSNVAVDGLIQGVPAFLTSPCAASAVGNMGLSRIMNPDMPDDRLRWASVLSDNQFSLSEIQDGTAWRLLNRGN